MPQTRTRWRRTKIVCTIGPATSSEAAIRKLVQAGMDVARLNLSHGTLDEHARYVQIVRSVSSKLGIEVAILMDLPGPKYRIGRLKDGGVELRRGSRITLTDKDVEGTATLLPVTLPNLSEGISVGKTILLDD